MIVNDQSPRALVRASLFTFCLMTATCGIGIASEPAADAGTVKAAEATSAALDASELPSKAPATVTIVADGSESTFTTSARTVGDALVERGIHVAASDAVSPDPSTALTGGTRIVLRRAIPLELRVGTSVRAIRSTAATVADLLRAERVRVGSADLVMPPLRSALVPNQTVHVVRVRSWTSREQCTIAPAVVNHPDPKLAAGTTKIVSDGRLGLRETTIRYTRFDESDPHATVLGTRTLREPQPRVIAHGTAVYGAFARVAALGFASAVHMAGSALRMIATAYTAGCYGCSGITASGVRAGFGIIAVDPSVIPLGTKVFIPGYGHAIAGDTGGAIQGHRVDLGFNTVAAAIRFGRRPVTLYVLR